MNYFILNFSNGKWEWRMRVIYNNNPTINYSNHYLFQRLWIEIGLRSYYQEVPQPLISNALAAFSIAFQFSSTPILEAAFPFTQACRLIEKIQINQVWGEKTEVGSSPRIFHVHSQFHLLPSILTILNDSLISRRGWRKKILVLEDTLLLREFRNEVCSGVIKRRI